MPVCLRSQENAESAEMFCDEAILQWLLDRKKYASQKRNRTKWITKLNAKKLTPTKNCNTPKRSKDSNSLRRGRSSGTIAESTADVFSPVAPHMLRTPVAKVVQKKKKENTRFQKKFTKEELNVRSVLFVCIVCCRFAS